MWLIENYKKTRKSWRHLDGMQWFDACNDPGDVERLW